MSPRNKPGGGAASQKAAFDPAFHTDRKPPKNKKAPVAAIICAAGASTRMGGMKKEYRPLPGKRSLTVLGAAVTAFTKIPEIKTIVIVVPSDAKTGEAAARKALPPRILEGENGPPIHFVSGGATRQASVFNALYFLADDKVDYVLIHDGARPWVSLSLIKRVIAAAKKHHAAIPLLPLTETPKETDMPLDDISDDNPVFIKQHLKRSVVGAAQTPQGFCFPAILAIHRKVSRQKKLKHIEFTDDAELWAAFEGPVAAILGETENRKITFPEDLC